MGPIEWEWSSRFKIRGTLGEGGFGTVYEAYDGERDALVALKALQRLSGDALYRFKREFRSLADVSHPNLVTLYELYGETERWYFTMELVRGQDFLTHALASDKPGDEMLIRPALAQLVAGLEALHAAGKLHRDIKPSNVLVDNSDRRGAKGHARAGMAPVEGVMGRREIASTPQWTDGYTRWIPPHFNAEAAAKASCPASR